MEDQFRCDQYMWHLSIAHLRQANRYYGSIFMQELLPKFYQDIVQQCDNLRSNNSK